MLRSASGASAASYKIGRLDEVALAHALGEAERLRPLIRQGADPVSQKAANREAMTFADLAAERLDKGDPLRPGTQRDYRHVLGKDVLPAIGNIPAKAVTRDDVIRVLDVISSRGASRRADTARAVISSIFSYGIDRGLVSDNPASGLRNRHDYQPRDVIASPDDIRWLWSAMDDGVAAMSPTIATIVRLALLTGLRRTEIAAARKVELDLDSTSPVLTIPRGRAKNRNAHRVPLSRRAASLFVRPSKPRARASSSSPAKEASSHIASRSVSKAMERTRAKLGIKDITMHDLRRTAGTYMSQYGVPKDVRERILNHGGSAKAASRKASTIAMSMTLKSALHWSFGRTHLPGSSRAARLKSAAIMRGSRASKERIRSRLPDLRRFKFSELILDELADAGVPSTCGMTLIRKFGADIAVLICEVSSARCL